MKIDIDTSNLIKRLECILFTEIKIYEKLENNELVFLARLKTTSVPSVNDTVTCFNNHYKVIDVVYADVDFNLINKKVFIYVKRVNKNV